MVRTKLYIPSIGGIAKKPLFRKVIDEHENVDTYVFVYEQDLEDYAEIEDYVTLVTVPGNPDKYKYPIAKKRQYMMKFAQANKHRYILMCDDDVKMVVRDVCRPGIVTKWGGSEYAKTLEETIGLFDQYGTEPMVFPARGRQGRDNYAAGEIIGLDKSMPSSVYRLDVKTLMEHDIQFKHIYAEDHELLLHMITKGLHSQMLLKVGFNSKGQGANEIIYKEDYSDMQESNNRIWKLYKDTVVAPIIAFKENKLGYTEVKIKGRNATRTAIIDGVKNGEN